MGSLIILATSQGRYKFGEGEDGTSIAVNINQQEVSSKELGKISWVCSVHINIMAVDQLAGLMCLKRNLPVYKEHCKLLFFYSHIRSR